MEKMTKEGLVIGYVEEVPNKVDETPVEVKEVEKEDAPKPKHAGGRPRKNM